MSKNKGSIHVPRERIRNFSIIAHIDHGKSTLADRLLELTDTVTQREARAQYMDKMDLERERGITIKSQTARLRYQAEDGLEYHLNLIDTPGHVDFNYEVSRSLKSCEGALLVVDASQGVQAQTLANVYLALDENLEIITVLNKVDLPAADVDRVRQEIEDSIGLDTSDCIPISAKSGLGVDTLLEAIVKRLPPPKGDPEAPTQALIFDSWYDSYRGVIAMIRVFQGQLKKGDKVRFMATGGEYELLDVGVNEPEMVPVPDLQPGEVGYIVCGIKEIRDVRVGDTVTMVKRPAPAALPGFKPAQQMVFSSIYPTETADFEPLREALQKLCLNDAAVSYEPETSGALGFGFRVGFLGLLHMEIVQERLEREFDMDLVITAPSVIYRLTLNDGTEKLVENPRTLPDPVHIKALGEPIVKAHIHTPQEYVGNIIKLCEDKRGIQKNMTYHGPTRVMLTYELPLSEVILDFFDKLKTCSRGYASLDYEVLEFRDDDLVKVDIYVNGDKVDALATIMHRSQAERKGRQLCEKLKEILPRHQFEVPIQAAIGGRIIARETVKSMGKNVTAKCYGGDITRKRKLLEKQKEGKKRMKQFGRVEIPQDAFMAILKVE
ncbi:MAG TPA: translation elongation factor 4 [Myxococcota bacterium]|nr:translation elongation factor 4 [Myxococcota bacterium]